ncbi:NAD(P)/FAD-dependent oxidoreductase [Butyrivibrio sp. NC3005]|uniref:NAD(P)/FAD-dependent oxidoreductase n=1 Tax=Butyrivibrio sp. NC3005 TaxID=1280685 RepID=UPI000426F748|nr:hypothetical protein [Butyrivibrio sp. NC3005]
MIRINNIKIKNGTDTKSFENGVQNPEVLKKAMFVHAAKALKISETAIEDIKIMRHSIDARKKPDIFDIYMIDVFIKAPNEKLKSTEEKILKKARNKNAQIEIEKKYIFPVSNENNMYNRPVVVGAGPCGLFAALMLSKNGYKPILIERGKSVDKRREDVENFWKTGKLDISSNVQFGEGGAGAFSDGKLNTMVKDKDGRGRFTLELFVEAGAPKEILYEAKPHIGTDKLIGVVENIRNQIISNGGEVLFEHKLTKLFLAEKDGTKCVSGIEIESSKGKRRIDTNHVILAIGHSARDTFEMLVSEKVYMEPKPFAIGLRVEHPQKMINKSQYGVESCETLPPSPYKVVHNTKKQRGVYSFCMCPGGYVVNASSEEKRLCVNGMSYYARDSRNANSAIIVTVDPSDFGGNGPLSGVEFQRRLEEKAYELGNGKIPVEYYKDFKANYFDDSEDRSTWNKPCTRGEYVFAPVHKLLPLDIKEAIDEGMEHFGKMIKGFDSDEALMEGIEARTSSPVRITRDENLEAIEIKGLYPSGEGAGYAGGIMSAAMDGIKSASAITSVFGRIK